MENHYTQFEQLLGEMKQLERLYAYWESCDTGRFVVPGAHTFTYKDTAFLVRLRHTAGAHMIDVEVWRNGKCEILMKRIPFAAENVKGQLLDLLDEHVNVRVCVTAEGEEMVGQAGSVSAKMPLRMQHGYCGGHMMQRRVSPHVQAWFCQECGLRVTAPVDIPTFDALQRYFKNKVL